MTASPAHRLRPSASAIPALIAHRGYTARYPENTLAALEAAASCGATHVEVDVQLSADGVPMLFHDETLERLCGVAGPIHQFDSTALAGLRAADAARFGARFADEPLAPLAAIADLLRRHPGVTAFIEAKGIAIEQFGAQAVLQAITRTLAGLAARYVLISFSLEFLQLARELTPQSLGAVIERWDERGKAPLQSLQPEYLFCDCQGLPATGPLATTDDCRLAVYEIADGDEALALAARGADMIETFSICEMRQFMQQAAAADCHE